MSKPNNKSEKGTMVNANGLRMLPKSFSPSINEVIIGRGRKVANHCGNQRFLELVHSQLGEYSKAKSKAAKSAIILRVLQKVKRDSPEDVGGFVKQDSNTKRWFAMEDASARISCAQAFRDALSGIYRSSKQYKQQRRWSLKASPSPSTLTTGTSATTTSSSKTSDPSTTAATTTSEGSPEIPELTELRAVPVASSSVCKNIGDEPLVSSMPALTLPTRKTTPTEKGPLSGLKGILDSALGIMEDDDFRFSLADDRRNTIPDFTESFRAPGPKDEPLCRMLDQFEHHVDVTANPFEPRPLCPASVGPRTQVTLEAFSSKTQENEINGFPPSTMNKPDKNGVPGFLSLRDALTISL